MAFSGNISGTVFNALKVTDHAFRRCRLPAQAITSEMQAYALDSLYVLLSDLANDKPPSWCIEKQLYPLYQGQYQVELDIGTVAVLNANLRTEQEATGTTTSSTTEYKVDFNDNEGGVATINVVGLKWSGTAVSLTFATSDDDATWTTVGNQTTSASAGEWTWKDIVPANPARYFRITSVGVRLASEIYLGTLPQEIPMGVLNRDTYVAQSNKVFQGRPLTYWFQRDIPRPVMNLWPSPNAAAEYQQLVVWRQRHIMDTDNLRQEVEIPQRWYEAVIDSLADRVGRETPAVDINLLPMLAARAAGSMARAWAGDNDGSPTFINPGISCYTR